MCHARDGAVVTDIPQKFCDMSEDERSRVMRTLSNPLWTDEYSDDRFDYAYETIRLVATVTDDWFLMRAVPWIRQWDQDGERICMRRIYDGLVESAGVDDDTLLACRERAKERAQVA